VHVPVVVAPFCEQLIPVGCDVIIPTPLPFIVTVS